MKELQNGAVIIMTMMFVMTITMANITGCQAQNTDVEIIPVPMEDPMKEPQQDIKCESVERYEFDVPGIEAHEVFTDCNTKLA